MSARSCAQFQPEPGAHLRCGGSLPGRPGRAGRHESRRGARTSACPSSGGYSRARTRTTRSWRTGTTQIKIQGGQVFFDQEVEAVAERTRSSCDDEPKRADVVSGRPRCHRELSTAGALRAAGPSVVGIDRWGSGHPGDVVDRRVAFDPGGVRRRAVRAARPGGVRGMASPRGGAGVTLLVESGQVDLGPDAEARRAGRRDASERRSVRRARRGRRPGSLPGDRPATRPTRAVPRRGGHGARRRRDAGAGRWTRGAPGPSSRCPSGASRSRSGRTSATVLTDGRILRAERVVIAAALVGRAASTAGMEPPARSRDGAGDVPRRAAARGSAGDRRLAGGRRGRRVRPSGAGGRLQGRVRCRSTDPWLPDVESLATRRRARRTGCSPGSPGGCPASSPASRSRSGIRGP